MASVRRLLLIIVVVYTLMTSTNRTIAQTEAVNLKQYTESDGLPSSQIYKLITDQFGYIWIGTINGLARFDGQTFRRFYSDPNDSTSFKGLNVWSIFEDSKGRIWIASGPSILNRYDPVTHSFKQYEFLSLIDHPANIEPGIPAIAETKSGKIIFGVSTNHGEAISTGLLFYNEEKDRIEKLNFNEGNILNIATDDQLNIYLLGYNGLFSLDDNLVAKRILLPINEFNIQYQSFSNIVCDKKGNVWLVSNKIKLFKYDPLSKVITSYSPKDTSIFYDYPNIALDQNGKIWLGTNKGLLSFNTETGKFETTDETTNQTLKNSGILSLNFDSFGSLWIGTFSGGLFRYDGNSIFESYSSKNKAGHSITFGWANNLYQSSDRKLWITTTGSGSINEGGINSIDFRKNKVTNYKFTDLNSKIYIIFSLYEFEPNKFYISTNDGVYIFNPSIHSANQRAKFPGVTEPVFIHEIHKDRSGTLWLCTFNGLYLKKQQDRDFKLIDLSKVENANISSNEITGLYETKEGLWLLTNNGLFFYEFATGKIARHGYNSKAMNVFISQDINSFYIDKNGIAWVGTWQGGLSRYDTKTGQIRTYTMNDGLPSMSIQGILADEKKNQLWLSTFEGLSRFNTKTGEFSNFSVADGLPSQLFADGANLRISNGLFVFGSSEGITVINPSKIQANSKPPRVFLTDLKLFNKSVIPGKNSLLQKPIYRTKEVKLKYHQNTLTFEFDVIHYKNPGRNIVAYILENYDNQWRDAGNQHFAFYSNIPPGDYVFKVKAASNNGIWTINGPVVKITIDPPWWKTSYAYAGYLILGIILIFIADKYFRYRVIKKEREHARIRELEHAHEIEKAYKELKNTQARLIQSEKMASLGELTAGIAHEIKNPLNFVNNFSELNTELLDELVTGIKKGEVDSSVSLAENIKKNEEKINYHGKRADSIIKGMLQHSRSNGTFEVTDINSLAQEYLQLAFHGMRAKDKSFNTTLITDFDINAGKLNIIPQEIGRVILNLLTNAFYSVMEKKERYGDRFEPMVTLTTAKIGSNIQIRIADNGTGIPNVILDKIFQPFFTTKPAGMGTGLGLSMSYEIITKGHGGDLKVESQEGEGAEFRIILPQKIQE